jgi:hypothetical protein
MNITITMPNRCAPDSTWLGEWQHKDSSTLRRPLRGGELHAENRARQFVNDRLSDQIVLALRRDVQQGQRFNQQELADDKGDLGFAETAIQPIRLHPVSPQ